MAMQRNATTVRSPESAGAGLARLVPVPATAAKGMTYEWVTRKGATVQMPILEVITVGGLKHAVIAFRVREASAATQFKKLTPEQQAQALAAVGS